MACHGTSPTYTLIWTPLPRKMEQSSSKFGVLRALGSVQCMVELCLTHGRPKTTVCDEAPCRSGGSGLWSKQTLLIPPQGKPASWRLDWKYPTSQQVPLPRLQLSRQPHLHQGGCWGGTMPRQGAGRPCLQPGACWGPVPQI